MGEKAELCGAVIREVENCFLHGGCKARGVGQYRFKLGTKRWIVYGAEAMMSGSGQEGARSESAQPEGVLVIM